MSGRLVYVIGPSGAGKDSVLTCLRASWPATHPTHWARRTISRPLTPQGEQHEPVDDETFDQLLDSQAFAIHWRANGLRYGVRKEELQPIHSGNWVFINGSRGHLPELLNLWPEATVVHIGASVHVLKERLLARGRETPEAVAQRLQREVSLQLPQGSITIQNDGALQTAADELLTQLLE